MSRWSFAALALLFTFQVFAAQEKVSQKKIGNLVLVERDFTLDLADCAKTYSQEQPVYGSCFVNLFKAENGETLADGSTFAEAYYTVGGSAVHVVIHATRSGYAVELNADGVVSLTFDNIKDKIADAMKKLDGKAIALVHTFE